MAKPKQEQIPRGNMTMDRLERFVSFMRNADYVGQGWEHRAMCVGEDPELFFPLAETMPYASQIGEAKSVCRACPVLADCLRSALCKGWGDGVFGGMTADERRALARYAARNGVHMDELVGTA